jgi:hypothetical protein
MIQSVRIHSGRFPQPVRTADQRAPTRSTPALKSSQSPPFQFPSSFLPIVIIFATILSATNLRSQSAVDQLPATPKPRLRFSPLDLAAIRSITPLGNLNPRGGHVFPTDHIYLDYGRKAGLPVYAPAAGSVLAIREQRGSDSKVEIRINERLSYYVAHLLLEDGVKTGSRVKDGQVLGYTSSSGALDLGCVDEDVTLAGFANPERYPGSTIHAVAPLKYYEEPLHTQLSAKVNAGADKDGKIDFDVSGRLVGNWFLEGLAIRDSARGEPAVWAKQLAFVSDIRQPGSVRISIGGTLAPAGIYQPAAEAPDPALVSPASGKTLYRFRRNENSASKAPLLLVEMVADDRVRVEFFPDPREGPVEFTSMALEYVR